MSRVGRRPIPIPSQVKVQIDGSTIHLEGPKGKMSHTLPAGIRISQSDSESPPGPGAASDSRSQLKVVRETEDSRARSLHGLTRTLVDNMVKGVTQGFVKELEIQGIGYRALVSGGKLELYVGFTHPVILPIPQGITIEVPKPTQLTVKGVDKQQVGQVAARIRAVAPPEPYKGKGIRFVGEAIRRKAGKAVA